MTDHGGRGRTSRWGMTKDEVVASAGMVLPNLHDVPSSTSSA